MAAATVAHENLVTVTTADVTLTPVVSVHVTVEVDEPEGSDVGYRL